MVRAFSCTTVSLFIFLFVVHYVRSAGNVSFFVPPSDPVLISQADALEAEASTRLKGLLAAAAAVPPATVQVAVTPAVTTPSSSAINTDPKRVLSTTEVAATKRPRDPTDDRAPKKQAQVQPHAPLKPSAVAQSAQNAGNQAALNCGVLNAVVPAQHAATGSAASPDATKLTETSVSSLEGDCAEVEDIQAKYQAELAW
jgi:hypothetical protein